MAFIGRQFFAATAVVEHTVTVWTIDHEQLSDPEGRARVDPTSKSSPMSASGSKRVIWQSSHDFRSPFGNGLRHGRLACLKGAKTGSEHSLYFGLLSLAVRCGFELRCQGFCNIRDVPCGFELLVALEVRVEFVLPSKSQIMPKM